MSLQDAVKKKLLSFDTLKCEWYFISNITLLLLQVMPLVVIFLFLPVIFSDLRVGNIVVLI